MSCILVIDDDREDQSLMQEAFEEINCHHIAHYTDNGESALSYLGSLTEMHHLPRLIVLDLNMPVMNGRETLEAIKKIERLKDIPVVVFTTSYNPIEKEETQKLGAIDYVIKPNTFTQFLETVGNFSTYCRDQQAQGPASGQPAA